MIRTTFQPLVSIITPTYNHERFIAACISSVVNQTYHGWEQIVIDDGSDDATGEIVKSFKDKRIRYVFQEHKGIWKLGEAYNTALEMAQGELIAILEGDDFWPEDKLEKQVPSFENSHVVMTWGKTRLIGPRGEKMEYLPPFNFARDKDIWTNRPIGNFLKKLLFMNPVPSVTVIIRKDALDKIGGFIQPPSLPLVDYPTWLELSLKGEIIAIDDVLGYYRRYIGQVTSRNATIWRDCTRYCMEFLPKIPLEIRKRIDVKQENVEKNYHLFERYDHWIRGRILLKEKDWIGAHQHFKKLITSRNIKFKIKGFAGYIASMGHFNLEWLIAIIGQSPFR